MKKVGTLNLKTLDKQKYKKINDISDMEKSICHTVSQTLPEVVLDQKNKVIYYFIYMPDFKQLIDLGYELFFTDFDDNCKKVFDQLHRSQMHTYVVRK